MTKLAFAAGLMLFTLAGCVTCRDPDKEEKTPEADYYQPGFLYEVDEDGNPVQDGAEEGPTREKESPDQ